MTAHKSWQHRQINMVASSTAGMNRGLYLRCRQLPVWTNAVPALDVGESWLPRAGSQEVNRNPETQKEDECPFWDSPGGGIFA